ncbi:hypothetical protein GCM10028818_22740 [Spirosoma horti]
MLRTFFTLIITAICLLTFSCKKAVDPDDKPELPKLGEIKQDQIIPTVGTPQLRTTVYVIDQETAANITSLTSAKIVFKSGTKLPGGRLASKLDVTSIKSGNVMIATATPQTPNGYMAKATKVTETSDGLEIETEPASWTDVFKDIEFAFDESIGQSLNYNKTFTFTGNNASAEVSAYAKGAVDFKFSFSLNIKESTLNDALAKVTITRTAGAGASAQASVSGSDEYPFFKKTFVITRVIMVGLLPIPIVITPTLTLKLRAAAGLKGTINATLVDWQDTYEYGLLYNKVKGFSQIEKNDNPTNHPSFDAKMEGFIESGVVSELSVGFYNSDAFVFGGSIYFYGRVTGACSTEKKGLSLIPSFGLDNSLFIGMDIFGIKNKKEFTKGISKNLDEIIVTGLKLCDPDSNKVDSTFTSVSTGDPHLITFDRFRYDFMAAGEFTALQSISDNFKIQVRQEPSGSSKTVSINTGLAIQTGQNTICFLPPNRLYIDTQLKTDSYSTTALSNGGSVSKLSNGYYYIRTSTGDKIEIRPYGGTLDYYITPNNNRRAKLKGLLGNFDGNKGNELSKPTGEIIPSNFLSVYPDYANSWRINKNESLFIYDTNKNSDSYTISDFPQTPVIIDQSARINAEQICRQKGVTDPSLLQACIIDVASTGDAQYADRAYRMQEVTHSVERFSIDDFGLFSKALLFSNGAIASQSQVDFTQTTSANQPSIFWKVNAFDVTNGYSTAFTISSSSNSPEIDIVLNRDIDNMYSQLSLLKVYNRLLYYGSTAYALPIDIFDGKNHRIELSVQRIRNQNGNTYHLEMSVDGVNVLKTDYPDNSTAEQIVAYPGLIGSGGSNKRVVVTGWSFKPL